MSCGSPCPDSDSFLDWTADVCPDLGVSAFV